jgi:hypothetical protein
MSDWYRATVQLSSLTGGTSAFLRHPEDGVSPRHPLWWRAMDVLVSVEMLRAVLTVSTMAAAEVT